MQLELKDAMKKEIQKMHSVEVQLADALKMLAHMAQNPELKQALETHRNETVDQAKRLETISDRMGWPAVGIASQTIKGLQMETLEDLGGAEPGPVTDVIIIDAAQKSEHLEIAAYGTLIAFARRMGDAQAADLLAQSLQEEKDADARLTKIAESGVNAQAISAPTPPTVPTIPA